MPLACHAQLADGNACCHGLLRHFTAAGDGKVFIDRIPVDNMPPLRNVLWAPVLILQVVRLQGVSSVRFDSLAARPIAHQLLPTSPAYNTRGILHAARALQGSMLVNEAHVLPDVKAEDGHMVLLDDADLRQLRSGVTAGLPCSMVPNQTQDGVLLSASIVKT